MAPRTTSRPTLVTALTLVGSSAATAGLGVYQWLELVSLRQGNQVACAIDATFNCATVWNTPFASNIHELLGVPVAGLGVVWGLTAMTLTFLATLRPHPALTAGVKVTAIVGLLSCLLFAGVSWRAGAVCLTCITTYVLTGIYGLTALLALGRPVLPEGRDALAGLGWAAAITALFFLAALYPGSRTPSANNSVLAEAGRDQVMEALENMPPSYATMASAARALWRRSSVKDTSPYPQRARLGPVSAPVHLVDFTDIMCGHCKHLEESLKQIRRLAPEGSLSLEARHFPLDGECNPKIEHSPRDGVRCTAAKAQICLEGSDGLWKVREELFARQPNLTRETVLEVASKAMPRPALEACIASSETAKKLSDDIQYALLYGIQGTPLVLLNGRETLPSEAFILGMVMSKGDADAPFFKKLPPPPAPPAP